MSLFLIVYDRKEGRLTEFRQFDSRDQKAAEDERLALELRRDANLEVVILEAGSAEQLRMTHARYFGAEDMGALAEQAASG